MEAPAWIIMRGLLAFDKLTAGPIHQSQNNANHHALNKKEYKSMLSFSSNKNIN